MGFATHLEFALSTTTTNLSLVKPTTSEAADIAVINSNMDLIDTAVTARALASRTVNGHALTGNVTVSAADVGLGNCDNTSDANKPISTATASSFTVLAANDLTVGEANMRRKDMTINSCSLSSQNLRLTFFTATKTETITQIRVAMGGTAAGATPTLIRFGIYTLDGSGNGTLAYSTANDTTLLASTSSGNYTKALSASFPKVSGTRYAIGLLCVTSYTAPTLCGHNVINGAEYLVAPTIAAGLGSQSDLPGNFTAAGLATAGYAPYVALIP